ITRIQENRAYLTSRHVDVPWSNKNLEIKWEHFTSKLEPAQKETWTAIISGPDAHKAVAEMVATLYDASLDAFMKHYWQQRLSVFRGDYTTASPQFENIPKQFQWVMGGLDSGYIGAEIRYRQFPYDFVQNYQRYDYAFRHRGLFDSRLAGSAPQASESLAINGVAGDSLFLGAKMLADRDESGLAGEPATSAQRGPDLGKVAARKNLNET